MQFANPKNSFSKERFHNDRFELLNFNFGKILDVQLNKKVCGVQREEFS